MAAVVEGPIDRLEQRVADIEHELKSASISEAERLRLYDKENKLLDEKMFLFKKLERCRFSLCWVQCGFFHRSLPPSCAGYAVQANEIPDT